MVDAFVEGAEVTEEEILDREFIELFNPYQKRKILLTPIGGNGFILGRGSKQFTPEVIKRVGRENIMVAGTRDKINSWWSLSSKILMHCLWSMKPTMSFHG